MEPKREEYFLLINGDTAGPYTLAELHTMWMDDKITLDTLFVRPGMQKCQPINLIMGLVISYDPNQAAAEEPKIDEDENPFTPFKGWLKWALLAIAIGLFGWLIVSNLRQAEVESLIMRAVVEQKPADIRIVNESEFEWQDVFVYLNGQPPEGYKRLLGNLKPNNSVELTLLEFRDPTGTPFEPWRMGVTEVWIGNEKIGYRSFRIRPLKM